MWLKAIADFQIRVVILNLDQTTFPAGGKNSCFRSHPLGVVAEPFVKRREFAYRTINHVGEIRAMQRVTVRLPRLQQNFRRIRKRAKNRLTADHHDLVLIGYRRGRANRMLKLTPLHDRDAMLSERRSVPDCPACPGMEKIGVMPLPVENPRQPPLGRRRPPGLSGAPSRRGEAAKQHTRFHANAPMWLGPSGTAQGRARFSTQPNGTWQGCAHQSLHAFSWSIPGPGHCYNATSFLIAHCSKNKRHPQVPFHFAPCRIRQQREP